LVIGNTKIYINKAADRISFYFLNSFVKNSSWSYRWTNASYFTLLFFL